ncbi:DUF4365 domain-containing protein [Paenibacillus thalictri]|uniref:DUF4365 domain-containing protein n=1 Tax=Paenibacillus thalictri TaxID=2527873 RepID=A0A4Q9DPX0_9BACL|nr:DUF4365 domain-containing protein [Paenibacillus thalictri]TBL78456.1 DUF4365 domain-containing protein [Paenibacillus thalictri]
MIHVSRVALSQRKERCKINLTKNLPEVAESHMQEADSLKYFNILVPSDMFLIRQEIGGDYGVDLILELKETKYATNIRAHIQLKSTSNKIYENDRPFSFPIPIKTINYLMNQPNSIVIIYIKQSNVFVWEWASKINEFLIGKEINIERTSQVTTSYPFTSLLTTESFKSIYDHISKTSTLVREMALQFSSSLFKKVRNDSFKAMLSQMNNEYYEAEELLKKSRYKEALSRLKPLSKYIKDESIFLRCALISIELGLFKDSVRYCDEILKLNPYSSQSYILKGISQFQLSLYDQAIGSFEMSLSIVQTVLVRNLRALAIWMNGDAITALSELSESLKLTNGKDRQALLYTAILQFEFYNFDQAFRNINFLIKLEPNNADALAAKGRFLRFLGKREEADSFFRKCLVVDKDHYHGLIGLALNLVENNDVLEALLYLSSWINLHSNIIFKKKLKNGQAVVLIDLLWKTTLSIHLEKLNNRDYVISMLDGSKVKFDISRPNDSVIIGAISTSNPSYMVPFIVKAYEKNSDFKKVLDRITSTTKLIPFFNPNQLIFTGFFENDSIIVNIKERYDGTYFEVLFNDQPMICGMTDTDNNKIGYNAFREHFNKNKEIQLNLVNLEKKEEKIIQGIKDVRFHCDINQNRVGR